MIVSVHKNMLLQKRHLQITTHIHQEMNVDVRGCAQHPYETWLVLIVPTVIVAAFSAMLFDSGGSTPAVLVFAGFWLTLPLTLISISASWILWGLTRRKRSTGLKVARGVAYLLPLIGLGLAGVGLLWIQTACSGNLSC